MRAGAWAALLLVVLLGLLGWMQWQSARRGPASIDAPLGLATSESPESADGADLAWPEGVRAPEEMEDAGARHAREPLDDVPAASRGDRSWLSIALTEKGTGQPIGGEPIAVFHRRPGPWPRIHDVESDEDGRVELPVPQGIPLRVETGAWLDPTGAWLDEDREIGRAVRDLEPLSPGERREIAIELAVGLDCVFWGRIVDEARRPVAGARIVEEDVLSKAADSDVLASSDASGLVGFRFATWRHETLRIEAAGFGPATFDPEPGFDEPDRAQLLPLRRAAGLRIRVIDSARARGVWLVAEGVELVVGSNRWEALFARNVVWEAELDAAGTCEVRGLPARVPLRASITRRGRRSYPIAEPLVLEPGEIREVEWRTRGATLLGRLVDQEGLPVAGTTLWIVKRIPRGEPPSEQALFDPASEKEVFAASKTDPEGRFRFEDVLPGPWWVGPRAWPENDTPSDAAAPLATRIDVPEGASQLEIEIRAWRGLTIAGWLLDPQGEPVARRNVWGYSQDLRGIVSAFTGRGGRFVLGPLAPGQYVLSADVAEFAPPERVEARAGDQDVKLVLRVAGAVRGQVVDHSSRHGVAAEVLISSPDASVGVQIRHSDESGFFSAETLEPGTYHVSASTRSGFAGVVGDLLVRTAMTLENVFVELHRGARLTVRYEGTDPDVQLIVSQGTAVVALDLIRSGTLATHVVPAGALAVRVQLGSGDEQVREVVLEPGEEREVVFELD